MSNEMKYSTRYVLDGLLGVVIKATVALSVVSIVVGLLFFVAKGGMM